MNNQLQLERVDEIDYEPLVSIIVPFYSNLGWLKEALDSIRIQTYRHYEVLLIDDGSPESISAEITSDERVRYHRINNSGPGNARNLGISLAQGEMMAFLDSDDIWMPNKLAVQVARMQSTGALWSYTSYETFGEQVEERLVKVNTSYADTLSYTVSPYIATPTVIIRSSILKENPQLRFNPNMRFGQDAYLWLTLKSSFQALGLSDVLCKVRLRGENAGQRAIVQLTARAALWRYAKEQKLLDKRDIKPSILAKVSMRLLMFGDYVMQGLKKRVSSDTLLENAARVLFLLPWALSKLNRGLLGDEYEL